MHGKKSRTHNSALSNNDVFSPTRRKSRAPSCAAEDASEPPTLPAAVATRIPTDDRATEDAAEVRAPLPRSSSIHGGRQKNNDASPWPAVGRSSPSSWCRACSLWRAQAPAMAPARARAPPCRAGGRGLCTSPSHSGGGRISRPSSSLRGRRVPCPTRPSQPVVESASLPPTTSSPREPAKPRRTREFVEERGDAFLRSAAARMQNG